MEATNENKHCKGHHVHHGHICVLISEGKIDEVRELVQSPKFICFNCGRVADDAINLCNPMPLSNK